jgi:hypothetical protein
VLQLLVVLRRLEPETSDGRSASSSLIKLFFEPPNLGEFVLVPPLSGQRSGGDWEGISDEAAFGFWQICWFLLWS